MQDRPGYIGTDGCLRGAVPGISILSLHFGQMISPVAYCTSYVSCVSPLVCCAQYNQKFPASHRFHTVFNIFPVSHRLLAMYIRGFLRDQRVRIEEKYE